MKLTKQELLEQINLYPDKYDGETILLYLTISRTNANPLFAAKVISHLGDIVSNKIYEMVQTLNHADEMSMYAIEVLKGNYIMPGDPEKLNAIQADNLTEVREHIKNTLYLSRRLDD